MFAVKMSRSRGIVKVSDLDPLSKYESLHLPELIAWPARYGQDRFLIMFGGLNLEMGMWKMLDDYLAGSGYGLILQLEVRLTAF